MDPKATYAVPTEVPLRNVQVLKLDNDKVLDTVPSANIDISAKYPRNWFAPWKLSPFSHTLEKEMVKWMRQIGVISSPEAEGYLRKAVIGKLSGNALPMANYEYGLYMCKFIALWTAWDDVVVEMGNARGSEAPLLALSGKDIGSSDPWIQGFKHLGDEIERLGASRDFRQTMSEKMKDWTKMALKEAELNSCSHSGDDQTFEDAIELRQLCFGGRVNTLIYERSLGIELPSEISNNERFKQLVDRLSFIACTGNDIVGVGKDIAHNQLKSNLVIRHNLFFNTSLRDSYNAIVQLHDKAVQEFDDLAAELLKVVADEWKERLQQLMNIMRYSISGYAFWHAEAERYHQYVTIEDQRKFVFHVKVKRQSAPPNTTSKL